MSGVKRRFRRVKVVGFKRVHSKRGTRVIHQQMYHGRIARGDYLIGHIAICYLANTLFQRKVYERVQLISASAVRRLNT